MKNSEIKELTTEELVAKISEEKEAIVRLKLNHAVSSLANPLTIRHSRRFIARLNTELAQRTKNEK